jgi:ABC-2 type transport system permease protein
MSGLLACVRKELLLLSRDLHGLALLFLMPLAFILIMSLALQNQFAERAGTQLKVLVSDGDNSEASRDLLTALNEGGAFNFIVATEQSSTEQTTQLRRGTYAFALQVDKGFSAKLLDNSNAATLLRIEVAPDTGKQTEAVFVNAVQAALGRERIRSLLRSVTGKTPQMPASNSAVQVSYAYDAGKAHNDKNSKDDSGTTRTSVQQSVPAWLVFAAFFVVVPLSNTLIRERQQGTLRRLRSTNLGTLNLLLGKLIPYFVINQLQVVLMLLAGRYLVPLLGGQALHINGSLWLLALMAATLSIAALGLALLIAVASSTTEQATLLGGTGNIVLAALGGIMVPKFLMPATMQTIANWSPMSWGLEGFLDVLLRSGTLRDVLPEAGGLTLLGVIAILAAWMIQSRRID